MPLFTAANAREMAARSAEVRRQRAEANRETFAFPAAAMPQAGSDTEEIYHSRAREIDVLLVKLKAQLMTEREPAKQDRLCAGIERLERVFQVYMGIPQPGRRKVNSVGRASTHAVTAWDPTPE